jgi:hypothetical protein
VSPLLVFSDDWGRHPSSCQHLVRRLLGTREVVWVNTIGTRPPRLDMRTARRVLEKLDHWRRPASVPTGAARGGESAPAAAPTVIAPRMWPSFASTPSRRLNRRMLRSALLPVIERMPQPPVILTTLPIVADLVGELPAERWVYYCVDDFAGWPGYDGATMQRMERELVPRMDVTIAASDALAEGLARLGARPQVLTHGVDLAEWSAPAAQAGPPAELAGLAPPYVLFWGVIDRRMDVGWIRALSDRMTEGSVVLMGPMEDPDPALARVPRVAIRPPVPFDRLPMLAASAAVLVMPYINAPVTRAMQPLKLKEYLATGRPAVVRRLPATQAWADACDVCSDAEAFARAVSKRLSGELPRVQAEARQRLTHESWDSKAVAFRDWIDAPRGTGQKECPLPSRPEPCLG